MYPKVILSKNYVPSYMENKQISRLNFPMKGDPAFYEGVGRKHYNPASNFLAEDNFPHNNIFVRKDNPVPIAKNARNYKSEKFLSADGDQHQKHINIENRNYYNAIQNNRSLKALGNRNQIETYDSLEKLQRKFDQKYFSPDPRHLNKAYNNLEGNRNNKHSNPQVGGLPSQSINNLKYRNRKGSPKNARKHESTISVFEDITKIYDKVHKKVNPNQRKIQKYDYIEQFNRQQQQRRFNPSHLYSYL